MVLRLSRQGSKNMLVYESIIANIDFSDKMNSIILCRGKAKDFVKLKAIGSKSSIEFESFLTLRTKVKSLEFIKTYYFINIIYLLLNNYVLGCNLALLIKARSFICRLFVSKNALILNYE
jgi:hypothetical protein